MDSLCPQFLLRPFKKAQIKFIFRPAAYGLYDPEPVYPPVIRGLPESPLHKRNNLSILPRQKLLCRICYLRIPVRKSRYDSRLQTVILKNKGMLLHGLGDGHQPSSSGLRQRLLQGMNLAVGQARRITA